MGLTVTCHTCKNLFVLQVWIAYPSLSRISPWQMNLGRANHSSQCVLPKDSLSLFLCSKEAAHFVQYLTRGPSPKQGQFQTGQMEGRKDWHLYKFQGNWCLQRVERQQQWGKTEIINWNTELSSYINVYSPGSFKIFREKDDFRHTVSKIETFLFHVALFHSFDSDNAVIPE